MCLAPACSDSETTTPPPGSSTECGEGTQEVDGVCVPTADPLDCGTGTFENDGECVPFDPSDATAPTTTINPTGGRFRAAPAVVTLTADEPAMIYVTTDGSDPSGATPVPSPASVVAIADGTQLRYYAMDPAGNQEAEQTADFTIDISATGPVTGFTATHAAGDIVLDWTNPTDADFGGVVIARINDAIDGAPIDGNTYAAGDAISQQLDVVYVGNAESFTDVGRPIGVAQYAIWAHDDLYNHARRVTAAAEVPLPTQTATVTMNMNNDTVTTSPAFANLGLTGSFRFNNGTSAGITLSIENTTNRVIHGVKLQWENLSEGTIPSDGTLLGTGEDYMRFTTDSGLGVGIAPGATMHREFTLSGVTASSVVTVDVELLENPIFIGSEWDNTEGLQLADARDTSSDQLGELATPAGPSDNNMRGVCSIVSHNGRYAYIYHRNNAVVSRIDLTTGVAAQNVLLSHSNYRASIQRMLHNTADSYLYAVLLDGEHSYRWDSNNGPTQSLGTELQHYLVKIDPDTLEEVGRLALTIPDANTNGVNAKGLAFSPDGEQAAITAWSWNGENTGDSDNLPSGDVYDSWVNIVDLNTMTEVDRDAATAGTQPMSIGAMDKPRDAAYHPAGTHLYVVSKRWGDNDSSADLNDIIVPTLIKVDLANDAVTVLDSVDDDDNDIAGYHTLTMHPNGSLWMSGQNGNGAGTPYGVRVLNTSNDQITTVTGTITRDGTFSVTFSADFTRAAVTTYSNDVHIFDLSDNSEVADLGLSSDSYGHTACLTPF